MNTHLAIKIKETTQFLDPISREVKGQTLIEGHTYHVTVTKETEEYIIVDAYLLMGGRIEFAHLLHKKYFDVVPK